MGVSEEEFGRLRIGMTGDTLATVVILVWGLAYLAAAALAPGLIANLAPGISTTVMVVVGFFLLWSVFRRSAVLYGLLALVQIGSMVGSWVGAIQWAVTYDPGLAAISMPGMDFVVALALVYKTIQLMEVDLDVMTDEGRSH